jgi:hypothetical protein
MASEQEAREIKRRHSAALLSQPGVYGGGVEKDDGDGYVITIHLGADAPPASGRLPTQIEGVPVKFIDSGPFYKQNR